MRRNTGTYQKFGNFQHFVPESLPPTNPPFIFNAEIISLHGEACFHLGLLNETARKVPDIKRFVRAYVIKEALLSSEIEGIHTTLLDIFTQPLSRTKPNKETQLVLNYTHALEVALGMMQKNGLPLASRVILAAHETLMSLGENSQATPGLYRTQSVRVGDLIPAPAPLVPELMKDLEVFINQNAHENSEMPPLIKAGLAHVQFETIHPFLDGNGRIGRLLIVLMLIDSGLLETPILYPSYYFKRYRTAYYHKLDRIRTHGDFEEWIAYYLTGIRDSAQDAYKRAQDINTLEKDLKDMISHDAQFSKTSDTAFATLQILFQNPVASIQSLSEGIGKTYNTTQRTLKQFITCGWVSEHTEQKRNKLYRFDPYLKLLEKEYF